MTPRATADKMFLYAALLVGAVGSTLMLSIWWKSHSLVSASDDAAAFCSKATPGTSGDAIVAAAHAAGANEVTRSKGQVVADFGICGCFVTLADDGTAVQGAMGCQPQ